MGNAATRMKRPEPQARVSMRRNRTPRGPFRQDIDHRVLGATLILILLLIAVLILLNEIEVYPAD